MKKGENDMKSAALIAPKLRFLYGDGKGNAIVRYTQDTEDSAITIAEEDLMTLKGLTFRKVCVKGAGAFVITPVDPVKPLSGKIAIVTGSAQGFGCSGHERGRSKICGGNDL